MLLVMPHKGKDNTTQRVRSAQEVSSALHDPQFNPMTNYSGFLHFFGLHYFFTDGTYYRSPLLHNKP